MRQTLFALAAIAAALAPRGPASASEVPARWGPYEIDLVDEAGRALPAFDHGGRTYVLGALGRRYLLRIRNRSVRRVEVVASVDGRDVVDGGPSAFAKRGYVVAPRGEVTIDGYRLSEASVAAFRFSSVPRAYAARRGDARDVGVVGVAFFSERSPDPARRYRPYPSRPHPEPHRSDAAPAPEDRSGAAPEEVPEDGPGARRAPAAPSDAVGDPLAREGLVPGPHRPGLGTEFGEERPSPVEQVAFARASARPEAVLTLRYDDRPGLIALGIDVDAVARAGRDDRWLRETATPFRSEGGYCEPPAGWRP